MAKPKRPVVCGCSPAWPWHERYCHLGLYGQPKMAEGGGIADLRPWHESESIVVFRRPDGKISYPGINTKPTPPGHERIVMRNDHEVAKFERANHVINEKRHYDSNGRGAEDA